jgi:hypothetical protein
VFRKWYDKTSVNWMTKDAAKYKNKKQQSIANLKEFVCSYSLVINIVRAKDNLVE